MAYGVNAPFGLKPYLSLGSAGLTEKTNEYFIYASADGATTYNTSIFTNDPVILSKTAANRTVRYGATIERYDPTNTAAAAANTASILGVFAGCEYVDMQQNTVSSPFWPASSIVYPGTKIRALVIDDPMVVYDIQVSTASDAPDNARFSATGANVPAVLAYFSQNFALGVGGGGATVVNPAAGSTITGQSAFYLNLVGSAGAASRTEDTLPLKVLGFTPDAQNLGSIFEADGVTVKPFLNVRVIINNHFAKKGNTGFTPG